MLFSPAASRERGTCACLVGPQLRDGYPVIRTATKERNHDHSNQRQVTKA